MKKELQKLYKHRDVIDAHIDRVGTFVDPPDTPRGNLVNTPRGDLLRRVAWLFLLLTLIFDSNFVSTTLSNPNGENLNLFFLYVLVVFWFHYLTDELRRDIGYILGYTNLNIYTEDPDKPGDKVGWLFFY